MSAETARNLVVGASRIVGFTGAGISTESGVPDFRSPNGVWAQNRIVDFREFVSSEEGRIEYWRQKIAGWPAMRDAQPNAGHHAFVELHRQGRLDALVTQNIERLHQRSGLPGDKVLELHGTTTEAVCLTCGDRITADEACRRVARRREGAALHGSAAGILKPATISFGQAMPHDVMLRAQVAAESVRSAARGRLLAGGRAGRVDPAHRRSRPGARLVIVNREPTLLDGIADAVVRGEIGAVLPELVRRDG